ncbi:MAG: glycosidase [Acidimicrobiales bacterium]|nr:glycosidase [Acidimicrobiales bacterium]
MKNQLPNGVMLNAYPDSIGQTLADTVRVLAMPEFRDVFSLFYLLPSAFHSDLDRGFSVIDYDLNEELVNEADLEALAQLNIMLKFDLVLNHLSVGSPQFQDVLERGDNSDYKDFFIDWNEFWEGNGEPSADGVVVPAPEHLNRLFMRKPGLPVLQVRFPDGSDRYYWNTFYQQVNIDNDGHRSYLGQMDLNAGSEKVWDFYADTLRKLSGFGARILRLDAFAYLHKEVGSTNFFNRPGTWDYLERLRKIAEECDLILLPEIHSEYGTGIHEELSDKGYPIYDFFFPGLVIDALDRGNNVHLAHWIGEIIDRDLKTVNMLGCHDGIPVIDLRGSTVSGVERPGLLADSEIEAVIERLLQRGGRVKNLYGPDGTKVSYYQVNATFFSALGENEASLRLARAIQLFMPGTPQVWYLDLFAGTNNYEAADAGGSGGHKEINRTNLTMDQITQGLQRTIVTDQLKMMRLRNTSAAFDGHLAVDALDPSRIMMTWTNDDESATLDADLNTKAFTITHSGAGKATVLSF